MDKSKALVTRLRDWQGLTQYTEEYFLCMEAAELIEELTDKIEYLTKTHVTNVGISHYHQKSEEKD